MTVFSLDGGSPLPSAWGYATAGDFRRKRSATFNPAVATDDEYELWSIPSHASGTPEVVAACDIGSNKQHVAPGDVLLSRINPRLNRTWVVWGKRDIAQIASTEWVVFPSHNGIDSQFFAALLSDSRMRDFLAANASGIGGSLTRVRPALFDNIRVPLPPLNEQRRIVDRIEALFDEIDRGVESLREAKRAIGLYRHSLLKSAFEGRLTADWRAKNSDKLETPEVLLARIREERERRYSVAFEDWERAVAEWKNGGENGRKPTKPEPAAGFDLLWTSEGSPWPSVRVRAVLGAPLVNGRSAKDRMGGFPVLRLTALKNGKIDLRESKEGDWSEEDAAPFLVKRDDIFISRGNGSKKLVGIGGRVLHEPTPVAFPDTMIRVRPDTSAVRPEYFLLAWNSRTVRQQIENAARTTAGIYKINQGHIRGFVLPLPSLAEQSEIVRILNERLEAVDTLQAEMDANLARAEALRQSILRRAFSGQLLPQDPADEPAQALLARISASRGGDSTKKPRKRARRRASTPLPS